MNGHWLIDPRFARARGLLDENPTRAWLAAQSLRDSYGWENPELGAFEHEAYMRHAWDRYPFPTALIGLPQALAYPMVKGIVQNAPGLSLLFPDLAAASPATMDQLGAGVSGWIEGLLDWMGDAYR